MLDVGTVNAQAVDRDKLSNPEALLLGSVILVALVFRLATLGGPLDEPSWRQCWSAYQARALAQESPPEFMRLKIPFAGHDDVCTQEFPLYVWMVWGVYKSLGVSESLVAARLVTLLCFMGGAAYLFGFAREIWGRRHAWVAVAVFAVLPLGMFYSRAVHYDVLTLALANGWLFHALRFYRRGLYQDVWVALCLGTLAATIKPFYFAVMAGPAVGALAVRRSFWSWRNVLIAALIGAVPMAAAWGFDLYRWFVLGGPGRGPTLLCPCETSLEPVADFVFGYPAERLNIGHWVRIVRELVWRVFTHAGACIAVVSLLGLTGGWSDGRRPALLGYWASMGVYTVLLFPMLGPRFHDYYYLPFLAPAALTIAWPLARGVNVREDLLPHAFRAGSMGLCLMLVAAGSCFGLWRLGYFRHDWQRVDAGAVIRRSTNPHDLVLYTAVGRSLSATDIRLPYFADRRGWSSSRDELVEERVDLFRRAGARYIAVLMSEGFPPDRFEFPSHFRGMREDFALPTSGGWLVLFDMDHPDAP